MNNEKHISDNELRNLMSRLPQAPADPWFTRKVLNRLPERKRHIAARIEIWACVAGAIITTVFGVKFVLSTLQAPTITVGDVFAYAVYLSLFAALITNIAQPLLRARVLR